MRIAFFLHVFLSISCYSFAQVDITNPDSIDIEEVIIQATRASKEDPVTFQDISLKDIERIYTGQDPAVLIQQLSPSVISYSDAGTDIGNYAQFRMRGISQSRINVTLNGVPLNDMVDQGVYFSNFSDFGNSVQSIQVQRGVGASNIGVASYAGAVNFESINVFDKDPSTSLQLTTGSFGTLRTSAEMKTGLLKNKIGGYGRISRTKVNGYKHNSASDSYSFFGSIGILGEKDVLKLTGFMGKTQNGQSYLPVLLTDIENDQRTNYNHPNDTDDFEQELIQLQYSRTLSSTTRFNASIYYGGARGDFPFSIDDQTQFVFGLSNNHYGLISHLTFENQKLALKSGIQAYKFDRTNYEFIAPNLTNPYDRDHTNKNEISVFGKASYDFDNFSFYGDLQLRSVSIEMIPEFIPGIFPDRKYDWLFLNFVGGINYKIGKHNSVYLSYGRTGREPTRSDIRNGVELEEYVNDIELGLRTTHRKLTLATNLFHMKFENEISQVGALQERSYMEIRQNVPNSSRSGIEIELKYAPTRKVDLIMNGAFMNTNVALFNNGNQDFQNVAHIFAPKWVIRPLIQYNPTQNFGIILSGRHVSSSFMELANLSDFQLPAHTVLNTQFDFRFNKNTSMSLFVNNIFDELYFTDGAPVDLDFDGNVEGPGYRVQPPRHFYVLFTIKI